MNESLSKNRGRANPLFSQLSQIDPVANRKRVLIKVYGFLMRLAEEAEDQDSLPDVVVEQEVQPTPVQLELLI